MEVLYWTAIGIGQYNLVVVYDVVVAVVVGDDDNAAEVVFGMIPVMRLYDGYVVSSQHQHHYHLHQLHEDSSL